MNWDSNQHCVYLMDVSSKKMHGDAVRPHQNTSYDDDVNNFTSLQDFKGTNF